MKPLDAPQSEHDFQPSPTEPIVHGVGQVPVAGDDLAAVTRERDALKAALTWYSEESNYWIRGVEADYQGNGTAYMKPTGPAPVSSDQGKKARETLAKLASGELRKPAE